ncbi:MAG: VWA domain-containing protein [Xanthobacteraceae bacterium]|nr:MAG: VWA domain-containing protein [Xanthobacteraceae bacterium]
MDEPADIREGFFADRVIGLARLLRAAGVPVGTSSVLDGLAAVAHLDVTRRDDVFTALRAVFVTRHEHHAVFAQAFDLYFRTAGMAPAVIEEPDAAVPALPPAPAMRRLAEAMAAARARAATDPAEPPAIIALTGSDRELLQRKDFAQMSAAELAEAEREIARMRLPLAAVVTRRLAPDPHGQRLDLRRTLRASLRAGGEIIDLRRLGRVQRPPPIVALLDISGSMSEYTRLFLHFLHAVTDARKRVTTFLFGTRLTNVTRMLRARDPDAALAACSAAVPDWSGGTRIAPSLHVFNKLWGRRVLGQGAIVLLISDGLEREVDQRLGFEMDRLHRSCRRLIWLNPLLRFEGFEARAQGIKMMLPHVDEFRPIHNLGTMADVVAALSRPAREQRRAA